jgi:1-deoxy-D-xylulose-5-phosphate reductoisomerase
MKKVLILGSTGSIGTQALEVIARSSELRVVGLAAGRGWELAVEHRPG